MMSTEQAVVAMPVGLFVGLPLVAVVVVEVVIWGLCLGFWPGNAGSAGLGALVAVGSIGVGAMVVAPWMPRTAGQWGVIALAGHGLTIMLLFGSALLLYSAARPDPLAFSVAVAAPFPVAMVVQAKFALGRTLGRLRMSENGQAAHTTEPGSS